MQLVLIHFHFSKVPEQPNNKGGKDNSHFLLTTLGPQASQMATISMEVNTGYSPLLENFILFHTIKPRLAFQL